MAHSDYAAWPVRAMAIQRAARLELSAHVGRRVRLASAAPDDYTIDRYHPDVDGADPRACAVVDATGSVTRGDRVATS